MESDAKLIEKINKGDLNAFETLYHRYRDWTFRLAYRFTRDHELAEDVLQETFIYLLKKFPGFELTARITTFLYPVVKFTSIQMLKISRRNMPLDESPELIAIPTQETSDLKSDLAKVLAILPGAQREVILMRFLDGFSIEEIAEVLKIPDGTVKSRIHKALQKLRENENTRRYFLE